MINEPKNKNIDKQISPESTPKADIFIVLAEGINSLVKSMDAFQAYFIRKEDSNKRDKRFNRLHSWGMVITTLIVALIGASATMYKTSKENVQQRKFQYEQGVRELTRQQIQSLDIQIHDKTSKRDLLNNALSKARNLIEVSQLYYCKNGKFTGDELDYNIKQINYLFQIVNANYSISQIFDDNIYMQSTKFLTLLDENKNACKGEKDFILKLRLLQRNLNEQMNK
jgi:ABC-type multidrug transport system fused ATPase/permease subunit